jgi:hypothetical protein
LSGAFAISGRGFLHGSVTPSGLRLFFVAVIYTIPSGLARDGNFKPEGVVEQPWEKLSAFDTTKVALCIIVLHPCMSTTLLEKESFSLSPIATRAHDMRLQLKNLLHFFGGCLHCKPLTVLHF